MARQPKWRGAVGMRESPNSPKYEHTQDGERWTKIYTGPYSLLIGNKPLRLQGFQGVPGKVDTVLVEKMPGGNGLMTVTLKPNPLPDQDSKDTEKPTLEVEWMELQKRAETHPIYATDGSKALTDSDLQAIDLWKNSTAGDRASKFTALSDNAKNLAAKILKGEDSYIVFYPIIRRTTPRSDGPSATSAGKINEPPITVNGFEFLKTADRHIRRGTCWSQVEEWTGAEKIDTDFYKNA